MIDQSQPFYQTDLSRWEAVVSRDREARDQFIYAVKTTGIYCRPGCGSRLPIRENTLFFESREEAEQAGFRACKRCRPDQVPTDDVQDQRILQACRSMDQAEEPLTLSELAAQAGLSESYFQRRFKAAVGLSPREYAAAVRQQRVRRQLTNGAPVTDAIYEAGYGSSSRFYEHSDEILGMTPSHFKKGGEGLDICYTAALSSLGLVLVAATARGVCHIEFGESEAALTDQLRQRFPNAVIRQSRDDLASRVEEVLALIDQPGRRSQLPLDIQGTVFQKQVWKALGQIPPGSRASYAQVAEMIGRPKSARAVARACASNRIALAVPCHRVVRSDGTLGGYRWGEDRKARILKREKQEDDGSVRKP